MGQCEYSPGLFFCYEPVFGGREVSTEQYHRCFTGMSNAWDFGLLSIGCGVGCPQCRDEPSRMVSDAGGDMMGGKRWLAPNPEGRARDAWGYYRDVRAGDSHPVPQVSSWVRGTCRTNYGIECFGSHVCECWGENETADPVTQPGTNLCQPGNISAGNPVDGYYHEDFFSIGMEWPLYPASETPLLGMGALHCRKFQESYPEQQDNAINLIAGNRGNMLEPLIVRSFFLDGALIMGGCQSNWLIPCIGRVVGGNAACNGYAVRNPDAMWYNDGPRRQRFNFLPIREWSPRIAYTGPTLTEDILHDRATRELKNTILGYVGREQIGETKFDQVDSDHATGNGNGQLNQFSRLYQSSQPQYGHVVPGLLGHCYLRESGHTVDVTLRIHEVRVFAIIMLHHLRKTRMSQEDERWCVPLVRLKIAVQLYWQVDLPSPCTLVRSWLPAGDPNHEVELRAEYDEGSMVPDIVPADTIVYTDTHGREISPFSEIEWRGWLGHRSKPSAWDQRTYITTTSIIGACDQVADGLDGLVIPGWPYAADSEPNAPSTVYEGRIVLGEI